MRAKKIYESLDSVFKPKNIETIKQEVYTDRRYRPKEFQDVVIALIKKGYRPRLFGSDVPGDYEQGDYTYMGIVIDWGNAAWINLKSAQELENINFAFHDSMFDEEPSIDSSVTVHKLRNDTYTAEVSVHLRNTWKTRISEYDEDYFYDGDKNEWIVSPDREWDPHSQPFNNVNELPARVLDKVERAEQYVAKEIYHLKKYGEHWGSDLPLPPGVVVN